MGHGMQPGEKPKDFKKSIKKLMSYIGKYKVAIFVVMFFAACSTIFNVAGPKILGKATTALSEGLMAKIQGTGSIDFGKIGSILLFVLGLYLCSVLPAQKRNLGKNQPHADEIFREPHLRRSIVPHYE